jgi:uncharacterized protein YggL (DUF469 family)
MHLGFNTLVYKKSLRIKNNSRNSKGSVQVSDFQEEIYEMAKEFRATNSALYVEDAVQRYIIAL